MLDAVTPELVPICGRASQVTSPVFHDVIIQRDQGYCRNYVLTYVPSMCDDREVRLSGEHSCGVASLLLISS